MMEPVISEQVVQRRELDLERDEAVVARSLVEPHVFATIFDRHFVPVHRYLHRRAGRDLADEIAGETFRVAFERRGTWRGQSDSARPWLYGIATNLLRRHRREESRRLRAFARSADDRFATLDEDAILARLDAGARGARLAAGLAALAPRDRDVVALLALGELTQREAAEALGIALGTVASRMHRAQRILADSARGATDA
jgi:RNA polymerase sigma factor (sigma-70 family)